MTALLIIAECALAVTAGGACCYRVVRWERRRLVREFAVLRATDLDRLCLDVRVPIEDLIAAADLEAVRAWEAEGLGPR
jgi:hypothetical protein